MPSGSARFRRPTQLAAFGALALGGVALAQTPIAQLSPDGVAIQGKVAEDFGGKFVLGDETGRVLVEPRGGLPSDVKLTVGETLTVTGIPRQRVFDATRISRGETVLFTGPAAPPSPAFAPPGFAAAASSDLPPAPPPAGIGQPQIDEALRAYRLTAVGPAERKKKHVEIPARDAQGTNVTVSLDLFGRMWEIEDSDEDDDRPVPTRITSPAQAQEAVRQAGLVPTGQVEQKKHHFEVWGRTPAGELVEAHLDFAGHVYKRAWVR